MARKKKAEDETGLNNEENNVTSAEEINKAIEEHNASLVTNNKVMIQLSPILIQRANNIISDIFTYLAYPDENNPMITKLYIEGSSVNKHVLEIEMGSNFRITEYGNRIQILLQVHPKLDSETATQYIERLNKEI